MDDMDRADHARRLVLQAHVSKLLREAMDDARADALPMFGVKGIQEPAVLDGEVIGKVNSKPAASSWSVDEALLLKWCLENRPGEVVQALRKSFVDGVVAFAKADREVATDDGEIVRARDLPGVTETQTRPNVVVTADPKARPVVLTWLGDGYAFDLGVQPKEVGS